MNKQLVIYSVVGIFILVCVLAAIYMFKPKSTATTTSATTLPNIATKFPNRSTTTSPPSMITTSPGTSITTSPGTSITTSPGTTTTPNPTQSDTMIDGRKYLIQNVESGKYIVISDNFALTTPYKQSATPFTFVKSSNSFIPEFRTKDNAGAVVTAQIYKGKDGGNLLFIGTERFAMLNTNNNYDQVIRGFPSDSTNFVSKAEDILKNNSAGYRVKFILQ